MSGQFPKSYSHDALGRLTNMVDAVGTTKYTYASGLLATEDGPWANDTVAWDYNTARKRSALRLQQTSTSWWTNSYAWDTSHRLASVTSPSGTFTYGYTGPGALRSGYSAPGGAVTNLYDDLGRLTLVNNGNRTSRTASGSRVMWMVYDALGRLLQSSGTPAGANRMRFSGKPWMAPGVDASAGLYDYGYRFYDPNTQRWVNRDPIGRTGL